MMTKVITTTERESQVIQEKASQGYELIRRHPGQANQVTLEFKSKDIRKPLLG